VQNGADYEGEKMPTNSGSGYGSGTGSSSGSGTGGAKLQFFQALRKNMERKGWRTVAVPGFDWAAIETAHYDLDSLFAAFDADTTDMLEGAHLMLSRWADTRAEKMPDTRIALAVFDSATPKQVEFITKELQEGTRMGKQSMTGVIDLKNGQVYEPQEGSGPGAARIRINKPVFAQLREVIQVLAAGY
jgi:hypothetical protein